MRKVRPSLLNFPLRIWGTESTAIEGFKTEGDEVVVTLAPAARAKGLHAEIWHRKWKVSLYAIVHRNFHPFERLTAGETYYFTAVAFNDSGESPQAPEQSFTVPLTTQFTDHFDTMDQILSRSSISYWRFPMGQTLAGILYAQTCNYGGRLDHLFIAGSFQLYIGFLYPLHSSWYCDFVYFSGQ